MKILVHALTLSLIFSFSASALAANVPPSGEYLNKAALKKAYKENCVKNIRALKKMLLENHTKIEGTIKSAGLSEDLNCNLDNDPFYAKTQNDEMVAYSNKYIKKIGAKAFIKEMDSTIIGNYNKYKIEELMQKVDSEGKISQKELEFLIAFEKSKTKLQALSTVVNNKLDEKTANNQSNDNRSSDTQDAL